MTEGMKALAAQLAVDALKTQPWGSATHFANAFVTVYDAMIAKLGE